MENGNRDILLRQTHADIVFLGKDGQITLLIEVKVKLQGIKARQEAISQLSSQMQKAKTDIPFAMLVDQVNIEIFRWNKDNFLKSIISLNTADILSHYEPEFSNKRILFLYMETLVEAWLRDLAYHWKSEIPPGSKELAAIGLLQRLEGGNTYSQVNLGADTLR